VFAPALFLFAGAALAGPCDDLADRVDRDRLEDTLLTLTGAQDLPDGGRIDSRHVEHPDHDVAQEWIVDAFAALGLDPELEPFDVADLPPIANVVAELAGDAPPVCLTAHYDSTGHAETGWNASTDPAPGADDDASGVSAVLEAARVLSEYEPGFEHALRFIAFDAEEQGLHGSWHHVDGLDEHGVALVLNLDPIGFNAAGSNTLWATYDERWKAEAEALATADEELDTPLSVTTVNAQLIGGDARSDHYPFWEAGWPAVHISSFPQPPEYHTPEDVAELVDLDFVHAVTRIVVRRACEVAEAREPIEDEEGAACSGCGAAAGASRSSLLLLVLVVLRRRRGE
jgi:hypothetical protein